MAEAAPGQSGPPVPGSVCVADATTVAQAYLKLSRQIQPHVDAGDCLLLGVMQGGMIPLVQLSSRLSGDFLLDYCHLTRYEGQTKGGVARWIRRPPAQIAARTVILIDDIFDAGITLDQVHRECLAIGARRVVSAVLVRKRHDRCQVATVPDYVGLEVPDRYVFGCGMDYRGRWRHLGEIYALGDGISPAS